jgi:hypothetical protein
MFEVDPTPVLPENFNDLDDAAKQKGEAELKAAKRYWVYAVYRKAEFDSTPKSDLNRACTLHLQAVYHTTTFGAKLNNFFGFSWTSTSISSIISSPSTILLMVRFSFFGGSCIIGYVVTLSYDHGRAGSTVISEH